MAQHKWHKEIKAWADGAEIECRHFGCEVWLDVPNPNWNNIVEYRIKPQPKKPQYLYAYDLIGQGEVYLYDCKQDEDTGIKYIGKIKLEVDDESTNSN
jgi:hypothetical protein